MGQNPPDGFRLTMRRLVMIPILYCAVLLATSVLLFKSSGVGGFELVWVTVLLLLPWAIGVTGSVVKSADPARIWVATVLRVLYVPALWICCAKIVYIFLNRVEGFRPSLMIIVLNTLFLVWYSRSLPRLSPRQCPGCKNRTLIPLLRFGKLDNTRTANTRWCASCGGKYWRDHQRVWRPERRKTWLDEAGSVEVGKDGTAARPRHVFTLISRVVKNATLR